MVTLALDTTTKAATSAVVSGARVVGEWAGDAAISPAAQLPRGLEDALAAAGCRLGDVDVLAVAVGPGSFTGSARRHRHDAGAGRGARASADRGLRPRRVDDVRGRGVR